MISLEQLNEIESKFNDCDHHFARTNNGEWCNICGAIKSFDIWLKPHWRDILIHLLLFVNSK